MAQIRVRPVYPLEDLAAEFGVPLALIRREIKEGRLPAFHVGRLLRVAGEDAIEWRDRYRDAAFLEGPQSPGRQPEPADARAAYPFQRETPPV